MFSSASQGDEPSRRASLGTAAPVGSERIESSSGGSVPLESGRCGRGRTRIMRSAASPAPPNTKRPGAGNSQNRGAAGAAPPKIGSPHSVSPVVGDFNFFVKKMRRHAAPRQPWVELSCSAGRGTIRCYAARCCASRHCAARCCVASRERQELLRVLENKF